MKKFLLTLRGRRERTSLSVVVALSAGLALTSVTPLAAHETGVIKLSAKQLPVGGALVITGAKMTKGASFRLELRGALRTFSFGRVRADTSGRFELRVTLPADAGAGAYTVAAVAADGDVSAQADLALLATTPTAGGGDMAGMPGMGNMPGMPHATAEHMKVPVTTSPEEWTAITTIIILAALGGFVLLRRRDDANEVTS